MNRHRDEVVKDVLFPAKIERCLDSEQVFDHTPVARYFA